MSTTVGTIIIEAARVMPSLTADTTLWTADGTDASVHGAPNNLQLQGNARLGPVAFERTPHRAPYSQEVFISGSGVRGPEAVELHLQVTDQRGLPAASSRLAAVLAAIDSAGVLRTPIGVFTPDGVLSYSRSPIVNGYNVVIQVGLKRGLHRSDAGLRLLGGSVWVLR